ncbi:MAG: alpha/beta hydrolase-fold protein [Candidatus Sphingomonas colombiensis]|nr:alpha/beta hydrolase-fold protein [Sphingomonas sp.]WEK42003.1 MAG: alpha/beta hydrolase-fold protein [Sphingomonas sp.]
MSMLRKIGFALAATLLSVAGSAQAQRRADAGAVRQDRAPGEPVTFAGARQYDMVSASTGRAYRIYLSIPASPPPPAGYPVLFVTDGDTNFIPAAIQSRLQVGEGVAPAVIVGIGYPDNDRLNRRNLDFTPPTPAEHVPPGLRDAWLNKQTSFGDAEPFFRFITQEVRPFVAAHARIDPANQALFGHSLGGLFTVQTMLAHPGAFRSYIASSPSLWWNDGELLKSPAHARAMKQQRLLVTVGALEQSTDQLLLPIGHDRDVMIATIKLARMVDNARELVGSIPSDGGSGNVALLEITPANFHAGNLSASIGRALRFAFSPPSDAGSAGK